MEASLFTLPKTDYDSYNQEDTCKFCSAQAHGTRAWDRRKGALVTLTSRQTNPFGFRKPRHVRRRGQGAQTVFCFDYDASDDFSHDGTNREQVRSKKVLADFAYNGTSMFVDEDGVRQYQVNVSRLKELAELTGPVFDQENSEETVLAWSEAVTVAQYAIQMQMVLNGHESYSALDEILFKTVASAVDGSFSFKVCYCFAHMDTPEYSSALGELPQVRYIGEGLYTVATAIKDEEERLLCIAALESNAELSVDDFLWAIKTFVEEQDAAACEALKASMIQAGLKASDDSSGLMERYGFRSEDAFMDESDRSLVEAFRSTLVALHVSGVDVDMFRPAGEPLMRFPSYLSYLWYEFAVNAQRVRVGFCEHCGRGFNLQGWRGRMKRVCPQCKDASINQRNKDRLGEARSLFMDEGLDITAIAARIYPNRDSEDACERIRHGLATYPLLKRQVKAEPSGTLAERCRRNGIEFAKRKKRGEGSGR